MRLPLRLVLAAGLAGLQFIAVIAVVFSSYFSSERVLISHARDLLRDVGTNTVAHSKGFLSPAEGAAELAARLAQNQVVASHDQPRLEQLLFQQLQIAPHFAGLYYGSAEGNFVMVSRVSGEAAPYRTKIISHSNGTRSVRLIWRRDDFSIAGMRDLPADTYDPRDRSWYLEASALRNTIWTDPYIFFTSQQPGITLAAPVLKRRGVRGVVGVDIGISEISEFLARLKVGKNGKALIINQNGDVIAHPDFDLLRITSADGLLRFATIDEIEDPVAREALKAVTQESRLLSVSRETSTRFISGGQSYVSTILPPISDTLPWTIVVYAPEADFTADIKENRSRNLWVAAAVAAITGLIGLILADYIHRPLRNFASMLSRISRDEVTTDSRSLRTYRELEAASETLMQQIIARRLAERDFGQTFERAPRAMAQLSAESRQLIRVNAKCVELLGAASAEALLGRSLAGFSLFPAAGRGEGEAETGRTVETRWRRIDGRLIWVSLNAILIRDDLGEPQHFILTIDDITGDKAREAEIERLNRDLSHLARGNTMGEMASGLAHELNQPLTAIAQNADTAKLVLDQDGDKAELRDLIQEIETGALRAGDIIRALRAFVRKDSGGTEEINLPALAGQTLTLLHAEASDARARIQTDFPPDLPLITGNRVQIAQVLMNLLRNAIEALASTEKGGDISLSARPDGPMLRIEVRDNGPGISSKINLFSQFETTKPEGMGLGLSICRSIIEANGGRLWCEAQLAADGKNPAQGAKFCFTLPLAGHAGQSPDQPLSQDKNGIQNV